MDYADQLGLDGEDFEALSVHLQRQTYDGIEYQHWPNHRRSIEKGTALFEGTVVRGFPKIPRTLVLAEGIPRHFEGQIAVEEKLNGYNVRVTRVDSRLLAFTRSGRICPFTTHKVQHVLDLDPFFDAYPELMLCGEMIGPENPYTAHNYPEVDSIAFRAFDIRDRVSGNPLPVRVRRARCNDFDVPQTDLLGVYEPAEATEKVAAIVRKLDRSGREGVVMKKIDGGGELKYTTSYANCDDLAYAFTLPFDYGCSFMFRRLIREGFQSYEWGESEAERCERARKIGEAILLPMTNTIENVGAGDPIYDRHTVRAEPSAIDALLDHLRNQGIHLDIEDDKREDDDRVVTFRKRIHRTNDKVKAYLDGTIVDE